MLFLRYVFSLFITVIMVILNCQQKNKIGKYDIYAPADVIDFRLDLLNVFILTSEVLRHKREIN